WKVAGDRFKEILEEWKTIRGVDRKTDGELWKRYATARDMFARRRGAHFATLDASRKQAQGQKEALVAAAEELSGSTEWAATAAQLKELMAEWKAAPRASKEVEQRLWERFRAAQDAFFARRSEVFSARDNEQKAALEKRQELLALAEALDVESDARAAQDAVGQPVADADARAGGRGRGAAGPGQGSRRRQADPRGRAGVGLEAAV